MGRQESIGSNKKGDSGPTLKEVKVQGRSPHKHGWAFHARCLKQARSWYSGTYAEGCSGAESQAARRSRQADESISLCAPGRQSSQQACRGAFRMGTCSCPYASQARLGWTESKGIPCRGRACPKTKQSRVVKRHGCRRQDRRRIAIRSHELASRPCPKSGA